MEDLLKQPVTVTEVRKGNTAALRDQDFKTWECTINNPTDLDIDFVTRIECTRKKL